MLSQVYLFTQKVFILTLFLLFRRQNLLVEVKTYLTASLTFKLGLQREVTSAFKKYSSFSSFGSESWSQHGQTEGN